MRLFLCAIFLFFILTFQIQSKEGETKEIDSFYLISTGDTLDKISYDNSSNFNIDNFYYQENLQNNFQNEDLFLHDAEIVEYMGMFFSSYDNRSNMKVKLRMRNKTTLDGGSIFWRVNFEYKPKKRAR